MLPFLTSKQLFKAEFLRLNLKDSSKITKIFHKNKKNWPKYVTKMYFMCFYLFCPGDLVTCSGEQETQSVSGRHPGELA